MTWAAVRDRLRSPDHRGVLGRQVAERLVEGMRRALAGDRRVFVLGSWRQVFGALGLPQPSDRAGRAAMRLLEQLTDAVVRVTAQTWRVCSHGCDRPTAEQLDLRWDAGRKAESARPGQPAPRRRPRKSLRARARAAALELVFGQRPVEPRARQLAAVALREPKGLRVAVTLTAKAGGDAVAQSVAGDFAGRVRGAGGGIELVPERTLRGRLHYHGVVLGLTASDVGRIADETAGMGQRALEQLEDPRRASYWAGYAWKAPAEGVAVLSMVDAPQIEVQDAPQPMGLVGKVREWWGRFRS